MKSITTFLLISFLLITVNNSEAQKSIQENTFLIVVDVQNDYSSKYESNEYSHFIESLNKLIVAIKPENVIYVASIHKALNISIKRIYVDTIISADLNEKLTTVNDQIFIKEEGDAFTVEKLKNLLVEKSATDIVVAGLLAEKCITKTLIGGQKRGFNMIVVPETVYGKTVKSRDKAISKLKKKGISCIELHELKAL